MSTSIISPSIATLKHCLAEQPIVNPSRAQILRKFSFAFPPLIMTDQGGWCTIESDPGVFSELLRSIGVQDVQVEELYTLDRNVLRNFGQVYGLVFLFKYRPNEKESAEKRSGFNTSTPDGLFFANQTIRNACATQAILSIVLNSSLDVGDDLRTFKDFSNEMDSVTKGMCLSNSEIIRAAHNSFALQQTLVIDDPSAEKEDPFHFVAYVPWKGRVYELDGLQEGPRDLGEEPSNSWLDRVIPDITSRIEEYSDGEIRFNLMAVVENQSKRLEKHIQELEADPNRNDGKLYDLRNQLAEQTRKKERWAVENARRRWNFMPFIVELLKAVAKAGRADDLIEKAMTKKKEAYRQALESKRAQNL